MASKVKKWTLFKLIAILLLLIYLYQKDPSDTSLSTYGVMEDFTLISSSNKEVNLYQELEKGPIVLSFYRGGWCPVCNLQLRTYQERLNEIRSLGAQLIAVSPETPSNSELTLVKNHLNFKVLHDNNNNLARKLGIIWQVPKAGQEGFSKWLKESSNKTLKDFNNQDGYELPVPATFVIDQNANIIYLFKDKNYKKRADINDIIKSLAQIKK